jgi:tape measure domain-containing protein
MIAGSLEIQLLANMARLQKDMDGARRSVSGAMESIEKAVGAAKAALGGLGGGIGLGQIISLTDQYTKFTAQLKLATTSTNEYARAYSDVQRIAKTAQADLGSTGVLYARIAQGTRELGVSQGQVADITETVNLALKVSGATAAESGSAMLQLSQAFASGALRGEEFNAVNEAAPRLMQALADGIGKPVGALKEMATNGELTSAVLAGALPKALAELRKEAAAVQTISGAFQLLKNEVLQFVGTQAEASGAVSVLTSGISMLANNLGLLAGVVLTVGASKLAQWAAGIATEMYAAVAASQAKAAASLAVAKADVTATAAAAALATARVAELRAAVLASEGNVALAVTTNGLIPAQARAAAASTAHAAALVAQSAAQKAASVGASVATGALGLLGGPIGWITTLLGLGATAWALWGGNSKKAEEAAAGAVQNSTQDIVANLDAQIKKLKERNALASAGLPGIGKSDTPEANKMASLKAQMDAASAGTGEFAGMNQGARNDIVAKLGAQYGTLYGRIQAVNEEKAKLEGTGQASKLSEWMDKYATKAEKLAAELAKAKKELGGKFTPEIESRIREQFAEKVAKGPKAKKTDAQKDAEEAAKFIDKLKEEVALYGASEEAQAAYQFAKLKGSQVQNEQAAKLGAELDALKKADAAKKQSAQQAKQLEQDRAQSQAQADADYQREIEQNAANVQQISFALMSETEREQAEHALRLAELQKFHDARVENERTANALIEAEKIRHEKTKAQVQAENEIYSVQLAANAADQLYGIMEKAGKEKSALGKTLFLASKALAVAEIILSTEVAAAKAGAQLGIFGLPMATMIRAVGYASAGMVAGMAIAEASAEGGYDIPAGVNPVVQTHQREMILPAEHADTIRNLGKDSGKGVTIINNTKGNIGQVTEHRRDDGERVLILDEVAAQMSDPNSKISRSLSRNFQTQRSR